MSKSVRNDKSKDNKRLNEGFSIILLNTDFLIYKSNFPSVWRKINLNKIIKIYKVNKWN